MDSLDQELRSQYLQIGKKAKYGTAGFRDLASHISYIVYRVGAFVTILNRTSPTKCLGVVLSASHNKIQDNGLKVTNFSGNMLEMEYEPILEAFVDQESLQKAVDDFKKYLISKGKTIYPGNVTIFTGGDTRPSTPKLLNLLIQGIKSQQGNAINFQTTTTPQLQYYVYLYNNVLKPKNNAPIEPETLRPQYWQRFCQYFEICAKSLNWNNVQKRTIDCANGVGGRIMPQFTKLLKQYFDIKLINCTNDSLLNKGCGADYIKVQGQFPSEYQSQQHNSFVTFDGDADRILLFSQKDNSLQLIDGDRQGTILTQFFKKISNQLKQKTNNLNKHQNMFFNVPSQPTIGFVQTYYANYSSSQYLLKKYQMKPVFAATGVKHLHQKAQHYDIGVYYQGNGHGTVIFNQQFLQKLDALLRNKDFLFESPMLKENPDARKQLEQYIQFVTFYYNSCRLANPSVGDAITNFLLIEVALKYMKMDYQSAMNLYCDLKSKTSKIQVKRKQTLRVTDIEDKVVEPAGLQESIQNILKQYNGKKAFLRASGTENVLRLHVQGQSKQIVEQITRKITELVQTTASLNQI